MPDRLSAAARSPRPTEAARGFAGGFRVGALGEVAIRCDDLDAMETFYSDVIGLELYAERDGGIVFFRISEGFAGHTCVLALFDARSAQRPVHPEFGGTVETGARSSLHHLALALSYEYQEKAISWYDRIGQPYRIEHFDWTGWRGVFTTDPEGNTVELVAATDAEPRDAGSRGRGPEGSSA